MTGGRRGGSRAVGAAASAVGDWDGVAPVERGVALEPSLRAPGDAGPQAARHLCHRRAAGRLGGCARRHGRRRRRRGRDRSALFRPGHGRADHSGGVGGRPRRGGRRRRPSWTGSRTVEVPGPAGGHDLLQLGGPRRAPPLRGHAGRGRASGAPSCPTCRSRSSTTGSGRRRGPAWPTVLLAAPVTPDDRLAQLCAAVPGASSTASTSWA